MLKKLGTDGQLNQRPNLRDTQMAQSAECLTRDFGSGRDLGSDRDLRVGLHTQWGVCLKSFLSLCPPNPPLSHSLSLSISKTHK